MAKSTFPVFLLLLLFSFPIRAQNVDSLTGSIQTDSALGQLPLLLDSNLLSEYSQLSSYKSILYAEGKSIVYDVQQFYPSRESGYVFFILLLLLSIVTYLKIAFSKDMEELLQSMVSKSIAHQLFRTQSKEISFSSLLLNLNFIVVVSLFVRFFLMKYFHVMSLESFSSALMLIFLFTFFYVTKVLALKFIGVLFELKEVCDEYIYNLFAILKTVGLTLIPVVFVLYAVPERISVYVFYSAFFVFIFFAAMLVWRGLSTANKLLYRSVYHFFIYVCVVEISPIFLLFKLLTKTIQ